MRQKATQTGELAMAMLLTARTLYLSPGWWPGESTRQDSGSELLASHVAFGNPPDSFLGGTWQMQVLVAASSQVLPRCLNAA